MSFLLSFFSLSNITVTNLYSSTYPLLAGVPSRASRLPTPSTYCRVFHKKLLCPLSSGVPENARGVLGCLTNDIRGFPAFTLYPLHLKKSHSPCAYAIFLLPLRSNSLHRIYYENNHHYLSSNYGTQVLSSLWCCIYLSARESRKMPMCRRGTLSRNSCTSGCTIPQPMPLPQVPVGVFYLSNVCLLSRMIFGYSLPLNSKL